MSEHLKISIGAAVRVGRQTAGLTQEELAERIGRHADTISLVERGKTLPTLDLLLEVANVLEVPLSSILSSDFGARSTSARRARLEAEISALICRVPDARLEYVRDQLNLLLNLR